VDITAYLDHALDRHRRVIEMTALADLVAARDAALVLRDLGTVLALRPLSGEDLRRLHVLLSQLHHAHPRTVDGVLDAELRDLVSTVWQLTRDATGGGETDDVLRRAGLPERRLHHGAHAGPQPA
jgi:hypothetical protein